MDADNDIMASAAKITPATPYNAANPLEDPEEHAHFRSVVAAFFFYQYEAMHDIARMDRDFSSMAPHF